MKRNWNARFGYKRSYDYLNMEHLVQFPHLRKLKLGECEDVYCDAEIDDTRFNTNISPHIGYTDEMNWGYSGTGPVNLAINILFTFTNGDVFFSRTNYLEFLNKFLLKNQRESLVIEKERILEWIDQKSSDSKLNGGALV